MDIDRCNCCSPKVMVPVVVFPAPPVRSVLLGREVFVTREPGKVRMLGDLCGIM